MVIIKLLTISLLVIGLYGCGGSVGVVSSGGSYTPGTINTYANPSSYQNPLFDPDPYTVLPGTTINVTPTGPCGH